MSDFEKANQHNKRPNSVAWELPKSTPGKISSALLNQAKSTNNNSKSKQIKVKESDLDSATGFKDFLPSHMNVKVRKLNNIINDDDDDEDENEDDEDDYNQYFLNELDYENEK